jgi:hypothetical protein
MAGRDEGITTNRKSFLLIFTSDGKNYKFESGFSQCAGGVYAIALIHRRKAIKNFDNSRRLQRAYFGTPFTISICARVLRES